MCEPPGYATISDVLYLIKKHSPLKIIFPFRVIILYHFSFKIAISLPPSSVSNIIIAVAANIKASPI